MAAPATKDLPRERLVQIAAIEESGEGIADGLITQGHLEPKIGQDQLDRLADRLGQGAQLAHRHGGGRAGRSVADLQMQEPQGLAPHGQGDAQIGTPETILNMGAMHSAGWVGDLVGLTAPQRPAVAQGQRRRQAPPAAPGHHQMQRLRALLPQRQGPPGNRQTGPSPPGR